MAQGMGNQAIADHLVVTLAAVEKHTQRIFAKLTLLPDDSGHRRVLAVLAYLRGHSPGHSAGSLSGTFYPG